MAYRIDINNKAYLERAFDACIASLERSKKNTNNVNVKMIPIIEEDIKIYQQAKASITEIK